jgi:hypothetical protein
VDADPTIIKKEFERFFKSPANLDYPGFYGNGKTAEFILNEIILMFDKV